MADGNACSWFVVDRKEDKDRDKDKKEGKEDKDKDKKEERDKEAGGGDKFFDNEVPETEAVEVGQDSPSGGKEGKDGKDGKEGKEGKDGGDVIKIKISTIGSPRVAAKEAKEKEVPSRPPLPSSPPLP